MAKRYLKRTRGLPFLLICNRKGKRSSVISGFEPNELRAVIAKAR